MKVKSVSDIRSLMRLTNEAEIAGDGWASINFIPSFDEQRDIGFSSNLISTYRLELCCQYVVKYGASRDEHGYHLDRCASALHRELYGNIVSSLSLLRHKIDFCTKDEAVKILDEILSDFDI